MALLINREKCGQEPSPVSFKQAATAVLNAPLLTGLKGPPHLILPCEPLNMSVWSAVEAIHVGLQMASLKFEAPLNTVQESETELQKGLVRTKKTNIFLVQNEIEIHI